jgi:hypothetical protein
MPCVRTIRIAGMILAIKLDTHLVFASLSYSSSPPEQTSTAVHHPQFAIPHVLRANVALLNPRIDGDLLVSLHAKNRRKDPRMRQLRIADKILAIVPDTTSPRTISPPWPKNPGSGGFMLGMIAPCVEGRGFCPSNYI